MLAWLVGGDPVTRTLQNRKWKILTEVKNRYFTKSLFSETLAIAISYHFSKLALALV